MMTKMSTKMTKQIMANNRLNKRCVAVLGHAEVRDDNLALIESTAMEFWRDKILVKLEANELPFRQEKTRIWRAQISVNRIKKQTLDGRSLVNVRDK